MPLAILEAIIDHTHMVSPPAPVSREVRARPELWRQARHRVPCAEQARRSFNLAMVGGGEAAIGFLLQPVRDCPSQKVIPKGYAASPCTQRQSHRRDSTARPHPAFRTKTR